MYYINILTRIKQQWLDSSEGGHLSLDSVEGHKGSFLGRTGPEPSINQLLAPELSHIVLEIKSIVWGWEKKDHVDRTRLHVRQSVNPRIGNSSFQSDLDFEVTIFKSFFSYPKLE